MGKQAHKDIFAKRGDETTLEWELRKAGLKANARNRDDPLVPVEREGAYRRDTVMHVETNTRALTAKLIELPSVIERWHMQGVPRFEEPAMNAMRQCIALWEARPILGNMAAGYAPTIKRGANDYDRHIIRALDDTAAIERYAAMFHPAHWRVYEAVVRYDRPLGEAGGALEDNGPQSTASARAIVGTVANFIAMHLRC